MKLIKEAISFLVTGRYLFSASVLLRVPAITNLRATGSATKNNILVTSIMAAKSLSIFTSILGTTVTVKMEPGVDGFLKGLMIAHEGKDSAPLKEQ